MGSLNHKFSFIWMLLISTSMVAQEKLRIMSIGGGVSEIVCALDFCDQIVAVDATSIFPASLKELPNLGYYRQLNAEGILQQKADLILMTEQAGPPHVVARLKKFDLPVHVISSEKTLPAARQRILQIGRILNVEDKALNLVKKMENDLAQAIQQKPAEQKKLRALFIYASGRQQVLSAGRGTSADAMFSLLGIENAAAAAEGYVNLSAESLLRMNPDFIVLTDRGKGLIADGNGANLKLPGLQLTKAGKQQQLILVDDLLFLGFSHRLGEAALDFVQRLKGLSWKSGNQ